jgi:hypothetical protein
LIRLIAAAKRVIKIKRCLNLLPPSRVSWTHLRMLSTRPSQTNHFKSILKNLNRSFSIYLAKNSIFVIQKMKRKLRIHLMRFNRIFLQRKITKLTFLILPGNQDRTLIPKARRTFQMISGLQRRQHLTNQLK